MGQQVKVLAAKSDGLSWNPGTHKVDGENRLLQVVLSDLHTITTKINKSVIKIKTNSKGRLPPSFLGPRRQAQR